MARRIALTGGYTAGHVYPALAVAEELARLAADADVLFLGGSSGIESRVVPRHGLRFEAIACGPVARASLASRSRSAVRLVLGIAQARRALRAHRTELVVGFGSHVSVPTVLAARTLGLGVALVEGNAAWGLATRLLAPLADRIYLGPLAARERLGAARCRPVGLPVRSAIAALAARDPVPPRPGEAHVLVTGGSSGSPFLDERAPSLVAALAARGVHAQVWHQTGDLDPEAVASRYAGRGLRARVEPFIEDMAGAYAWAHLAIVQGGAGTLAELSIAGVPALLVPDPRCAGDHQTANAVAFAARTGARWATEEDLARDGLDALAPLLDQPERWREAAARMRLLSSPEAAQAIARECLAR